jgi:hypothetical protein
MGRGLLYQRERERDSLASLAERTRGVQDSVRGVSGQVLESAFYSFFKRNHDQLQVCTHEMRACAGLLVELSSTHHLVLTIMHC